MKKIAPILFLVVFIFISCNGNAQNKTKENKEYKITKKDSEWKKLLSPLEYFVLRNSGTERAFSSTLNKNYKKGTYLCAACNTPLYNSEHKYDSGSGWPSFDRSIENTIELNVDYKIGYARTELKCNTCGSHLGHSFDDGPTETTGKRHCINGIALKFKPKEE